MEPRIEKPEWRKSTRSSASGQCVELHRSLTAVRDSKNGATLRLGRPVVVRLLATARRATT